MDRGWTGANWCRSNPTMSSARTSSCGWPRSWGSRHLRERERPHARASRPGRPPVPEARAQPQRPRRGGCSAP
eukprot:4186675-Alexandrium_andersonii.AAC.1